MLVPWLSCVLVLALGACYCYSSAARHLSKRLCLPPFCLLVVWCSFLFLLLSVATAGPPALPSGAACLEIPKIPSNAVLSLPVLVADCITASPPALPSGAAFLGIPKSLSNAVLSIWTQIAEPTTAVACLIELPCLCFAAFEHYCPKGAPLLLCASRGSWCRCRIECSCCLKHRSSTGGAGVRGVVGVVVLHL